MRKRRVPATAWFSVRGAAVLWLCGGSVIAGPAEDYAEGSKAYGRGDLTRSMQRLERASAGDPSARQKIDNLDNALHGRADAQE